MAAAAATSPNTAFRNLQAEQQRLEAEYASTHNVNNNTANLAAAAEASRKKSNDALRRYFHSLSGNDSYNARRDQAQDVQPFSFEIRELTRPKSTNTLRAEQDKQQRIEDEEKHLKTKFKANPVPPSTFLPKYQIMVDEWCARKEAVKVVAEQRAKEAKESSQVAKDFAKDWRKEQNKNSRRAHKAQTREEAWEEWKRKHCRQFKARPIPESTYIPNTLLEEEREASRADRVKARADQLLYESHAPRRMEESLAARVRDRANKIVETHEMKKLPYKEKALKQRDALRHANPNFTFQPEIHRDVPRFNELWAQERLRTAVTKQKIREELRHNEAGQNQLAQSEQDGGFSALKEHAVMTDTHKYARLEKAKRKFLQASGGKITPEQELQRRLGSGHDASDIDPTVATVILETSAEEILYRKKGIDAALFNRSASATRPSTAGGRAADVPCQRPRTTHAHVVKSAAIYKNIVAEEERALEEEKIIKERARRNKEVYDRLLRAGLVEKPKQRPASAPGASKYESRATSTSTGGNIIDWDAKIAEKKKQQRQESQEHKKRLNEMKQKVKSQPPIFVAEQQATYAFADLTKARASAEANIMEAWKKAGLDDDAAYAMMKTSGGGGNAPAPLQQQHDTVVSPMSQPPTSGRNDNNAGAIASAAAPKKDEEFETSSSSSDDESSSSSSSSSGSSSSSSSSSSASSSSSSSSSD